MPLVAFFWYSAMIGKGVIVMPSTLPKFTLRTDKVTLEKFRYIADNNFRTVNKELEMLMQQHIAEYEKQHGPIRLSPNDG